MSAAKIRKGDTVIVLSGKDKGKTGEVTASLPKDGKVVVRENFEDCLTVQPAAEWEKNIAARIAELDEIDSKKNRDIKRMMFGSVVECELDKQGRICITPDHIRNAGIGKEVVFRGMHDSFEIWDRRKWEAYRKAYRKQWEESA